ncbi:3',5'-cyclic-AMP phosphodiesterase [Halopseudomonas pelagia]|uniref:3',5'-cyclic-AMP phosphodiesterase n=1 Tax=Halopseudomonas pelagia TaxID=553151 RepID=UPI00039DEE8E|nr:3',5'-cyclic-AMP phosphodiesterase [Halopseudomonas pelagia]|tara:strand:- start:255864 stop:256676 length:813 start_codon:yes stop_codon:yes gene_type:complete
MLSPVTTRADHVCVLQLTDSHLYADPGADLLGLDTHESLQAVIDLVLDEQPTMDLVLATGDIAQDGSEAAYQRFMNAMQRLPAPCHWIAGNHDNAELMQQLGAESGLSREWVDLGRWRIVLLNSNIPGAVAGHLGATELAVLDRALEGAGERFVMVCLHHHPVPIGCGWMDPLGLLNAPDLLGRLEADQRVRLVLWGHIHQHFDQQRAGLRLLASPSTCVQFAAHSENFATDERAPGYRWLRLFDDGHVETAVSRLAEGRFLPDPGATGY